MKITTAWVDDPTLYGVLDLPRLAIEVTEEPDVSIQPEPFAGGWTVGKYGPFVKYRCATEKVNAGDFNVRFRTRFPVVVDVDLYVGEEAFPIEGYCLPLRRARQLVRKYDPIWRLLVSDKEAEAGTFLWVPVQVDPSCRHWTGKSVCGERPTHTVRAGKVSLPLCAPHLQEHNEKRAEKRAASSTSK